MTKLTNEDYAIFRAQSRRWVEKHGACVRPMRWGVSDVEYNDYHSMLAHEKRKAKGRVGKIGAPL